jgi:hypothetical protein|tara:strand:+ start:1478 stop:1750 length:273 start_codon:yes stop_codon:yes gene_type:complete
MPILAVKSDSPLGSFSGGMPETKKRWFKGEQREVSQRTADYLLKTFGDVFEDVSSASAAVGEPEVNKAMKAPPKKKAAPKKKAPKKKVTS